jgi:FMN phosphatase YigB (HAD superfamily)
MNIETINLLNKIKIEKYQGIIFDCFGTLLNIQTYHPYKEIKDILNLSKNDILKKNITLQEIEEKTTPDIFHLFLEKLEQDFNTIHLFSDAEMILNILEKKKIKYLICSNLASVYGDIVKKFVPQEKLILSYEIGYKKPENEIYQICEKKLNYDKKNILFVGDNLFNDYLEPQKYGFQSLFLKRIL